MNRCKALALIMVLAFPGCSGGGGSGNDGLFGDGIGDKRKVSIDAVFGSELSRTSNGSYETTGSFVGLSGDGFISPSKANCSDNLPQKLRISWRNAANGSSGAGRSRAGCFHLILSVRVSTWSIPHDAIPLALGANKITVTARDARGKSQSASITVTRTVLLVAEPRFTPFTREDGNASFMALQYQSIWDVHSAHEPVNATDPDRPYTSQPGHFDNQRILADLALRVEPADYDFVLLYSLTELPGWTRMGEPCEYPARNIGLDNSKYGADLCSNIRGPWSKLRAIPHMNTVSYVVGNRGFPHGPWNVLMPINLMGHIWGSYWVRYAVNTRDWNPEQHSVAVLASNGRFWTSEDHWFAAGLPGVLGSTPWGDQFNAFDLYAMGLMDYQEVKNYQYFVHASYDESILYPLTVDDLIDQLRRSGGVYYSGDGRRDPPTDASVNHINALVVLVTGSDEQVSPVQIELLLDIAQNLPEAWHSATWGRSTLSTELILR